jgi:hypothetical protein
MMDIANSAVFFLLYTDGRFLVDGGGGAVIVVALLWGS